MFIASCTHKTLQQSYDQMRHFLEQTTNQKQSIKSANKLLTFKTF